MVLLQDLAGPLNVKVLFAVFAPRQAVGSGTRQTSFPIFCCSLLSSSSFLSRERDSNNLRLIWQPHSPVTILSLDTHRWAPSYIQFFQDLLKFCRLSAGPETLARSLAAPKPLNDIDYSELIKLIAGHFCPKPSVIVQRHHFNKINQGTEFVSTYVAELRKLSEN
ncbi:hypothetical protein LAZ67_13002025 [Cordylochernes scorpioides]|uniref:Uncharacterized protein n=1 Tax=Cordylochernes scorpioides TaxID=51811 RepID=A0ABY6L4B0_9ARAC|nr:hypothetical protein LAZ67_13002025 [Cordylochernes scorpioides]